MAVVYILKSKDKYELPLAVCDTVSELARIAGVKADSIYTMLSHKKHGSIKSCPYERVEI